MSDTVNTAILTKRLGADESEDKVNYSFNKLWGATNGTMLFGLGG